MLPQIEDVHVVRDRLTGASRGFGFVKFYDMGIQQRVIDIHEHAIDGLGRCWNLLP